ncbi:hypothetical protein FPQ18DRAFT_384414 [Pyronema domesticum]|nr:hypothetical protein FPQ18DRAFT_384414 [Pyronema domesticum]
MRLEPSNKIPGQIYCETEVEHISELQIPPILTEEPLEPDSYEYAWRERARKYAARLKADEEKYRREFEERLQTHTFAEQPFLSDPKYYEAEHEHIPEKPEPQPVIYRHVIEQYKQDWISPSSLEGYFDNATWTQNPGKTPEGVPAFIDNEKPIPINKASPDSIPGYIDNARRSVGLDPMNSQDSFTEFINHARLAKNPGRTVSKRGWNFSRWMKELRAKDEKDEAFTKGGTHQGIQRCKDGLEL